MNADANGHREALADQIGRSVAAGATLADAGASVGVSATTACRLLLAYLPDLPRKRHRLMTTTERRRIVSLSEAGEDSVRAIARNVERSWAAVRRVLDQADCLRSAQPHRCPTCGRRINTTVCVYCRAMQHQAARIGAAGKG